MFSRLSGRSSDKDKDKASSSRGQDDAASVKSSSRRKERSERSSVDDYGRESSSRKKSSSSKTSSSRGDDRDRGYADGDSTYDTSSRRSRTDEKSHRSRDEDRDDDDGKRRRHRRDGSADTTKSSRRRRSRSGERSATSSRRDKDRDRDEDRDRDRDDRRRSAYASDSDRNTRGLPYEATRGDFDTPSGPGGMSQFPGQTTSTMPGMPGGFHRTDSNHSYQNGGASSVPQQFPGQFPSEIASPYRPPVASHEGGPGLATDYYYDQGQSVHNQPGARPGTPVVAGMEPHLKPASSAANPPAEPSASGNQGAAAAYYDADADFGHTPDRPANVSGKPGSKPARQPSRPSQSSSNGFAATAATAAAGAAAGYFVSGEQHHTNGQGTSYEASTSGYRPGRPSSDRPSSYHTASSAQQQATSPAISPGMLPQNSHHSNTGLYAAGAAAGAAGLAAYALHEHEQHEHQNHTQHSSAQYGVSDEYSKPPPGFHYVGSHSGNYGYGSDLGYASGAGAAGAMGVAQQHRHRGPIARFVDFFRDPEGVAKFEQYTEYIGVCRYCFDPRSSPRDAPRKHYYGRSRKSWENLNISRESLHSRKSWEKMNGSRTSLNRIDKESRYGVDGKLKRRSSGKSERRYSGEETRVSSSGGGIGTGVLAGAAAAVGAGIVGEKIMRRNTDFDDTYEVKHGQVAEEALHLRHPSRRDSSEGFRRESSTVSYGITGSRKSEVKESKVSKGEIIGVDREGNPIRRRSSLKNGSSSAAQLSGKDDKKGSGHGLVEAAVGAGIGIAAAEALSRRERSSSPGRRTSKSSKRRDSSASSTSSRKRRVRRRSSDKGQRSGFWGALIGGSSSKSKKSSKSSSSSKKRKEKKSGLGFFSNDSQSSNDAHLVFESDRNRYESSDSKGKGKRPKRGDSPGINSAAQARDALAAIGTISAAVAVANQAKKHGYSSSSDNRDRRDGRLSGVRKAYDQSSRRRHASDPDANEWTDEEDDHDSVNMDLAWGSSTNLHRQQSNGNAGGGIFSSFWGTKERSPSPVLRDREHRHTPTAATFGAAAVGGVAAAAALHEMNKRSSSKRDESYASSTSMVPLKEVPPMPVGTPPHYSAERPGPTPLQPHEIHQPQPVSPVKKQVYQADHVPGEFPEDEPPVRVVEIEPGRNGRRKNSIGPGSKVSFNFTKEEEERHEREEREALERQRKKAIESGIEYRPEEPPRREDKRREVAVDGAHRQEIDRLDREIERLRNSKSDSEQKQSSSIIGPVGGAVVGAAIVGAMAAGHQRSNSSPEDRRERSQKRRQERAQPTSVDGAFIPSYTSSAVSEKDGYRQEYRDDRDVVPRKTDKAERYAEASERGRESVREDELAKEVMASTNTSRVAKRAADIIRRSPSPANHEYESYADFFKPDLAKPAGTKQRKVDPIGDNDIDVYHVSTDGAVVPEVITIAPKESRETTPDPSPIDIKRSTSPFTFPGDAEYRPDTSNLRLPWMVPHLKLLRPTPEPSPRIGPVADKDVEDIEEIKDVTESTDSPSKRGVSFGESQTHRYVPPTPEEEHDHYARDAAIAGVGAAAAAAAGAAYVSHKRDEQTKRNEPETPVEELTRDDIDREEREWKRSHDIPGGFGEDNEFIATMAAGLKDSGFDPNIVINDPNVYKRESPPGSEDEYVRGKKSSSSRSRDVSFDRRNRKPSPLDEVLGFRPPSPGTEGAPPVQGYAESLPDSPTELSRTSTREQGRAKSEIIVPTYQATNDDEWQESREKGKKDKKKRKSSSGPDLATIAAAATGAAAAGTAITAFSHHEADRDILPEVKAEDARDVREPDVDLSKLSKKERKNLEKAKRASMDASQWDVEEPVQPKSQPEVLSGEARNGYQAAEADVDYSSLSKKERKNLKKQKRASMDAAQWDIEEPAAPQNQFDAPIEQSRDIEQTLENQDTPEIDYSTLSKKERKRLEKAKRASMEATQWEPQDTIRKVEDDNDAELSIIDDAAARDPDDEWADTAPKKKKKGRQSTRELMEKAVAHNDDELDIINDAADQPPALASVVEALQNRQKSQDSVVREHSRQSPSPSQSRDEFFDAEAEAIALEDDMPTPTKERSRPTSPIATGVPLPEDEDRAATPTMENMKSRYQVPSFGDRDVVYESPSDDAVSVAATAIGGAGDADKRKKKKRRSRHADDDAASVMSAPSRSERTKDRESPKEEKKKGGFFGLVSRLTEDGTEKRRREERERAEKEEAERKERKKHRHSRDGASRDGASAYGSDDDFVSAVSRRSKTGSDDDAKSEKRRKHRSRSENGDKPLKSESDAFPDRSTIRRVPDEDVDLRNTQRDDGDFDQSFLGERPEPNKPPDDTDDDDEKASSRREAMAGLGLATGAAIAAGAFAYHEHETDRVSPTRTQDDLELPRMGSSESPLATPSRHRRPLSHAQSEIGALVGPSPTAVPLVFRRPPNSRAGSTQSTPAGTQSTPATPAGKKDKRPGSKEFKGKADVRPLYLVERHNKPVQDFDPEEEFPELPPSRETSRASSVHASDSPKQEDPEIFGASSAKPRASPVQPLDLQAARDIKPGDVLDSQQVTPTPLSVATDRKQREAALLDAALHERMSAELEWQQRQRKGSTLSQPPELPFEYSRELGDERSDSPDSTTVDFNKKPSRPDPFYIPPYSPKEEQDHSGLAAGLGAAAVAGGAALMFAEHEKHKEREASRERGERHSQEDDLSRDLQPEVEAPAETEETREILDTEQPEPQASVETEPSAEWEAPTSKKKKNKKGKGKKRESFLDTPAESTDSPASDKIDLQQAGDETEVDAAAIPLPFGPDEDLEAMTHVDFGFHQTEQEIPREHEEEEAGDDFHDAVAEQDEVSREAASDLPPSPTQRARELDDNFSLAETVVNPEVEYEDGKDFDDTASMSSVKKSKKKQKKEAKRRSEQLALEAAAGTAGAATGLEALRELTEQEEPIPDQGYVIANRAELSLPAGFKPSLSRKSTAQLIAEIESGISGPIEAAREAKADEPASAQPEEATAEDVFAEEPAAESKKSKKGKKAKKEEKAKKGKKSKGKKDEAEEPSAEPEEADAEEQPTVVDTPIPEQLLDDDGFPTIPSEVIAARTGLRSIPSAALISPPATSASGYAELDPSMLRYKKPASAETQPSDESLGPDETLPDFTDSTPEQQQTESLSMLVDDDAQPTADAQDEDDAILARDIQDAEMTEAQPDEFLNNPQVDFTGEEALLTDLSFSLDKKQEGAPDDVEMAEAVEATPASESVLDEKPTEEAEPDWFTPAGKKKGKKDKKKNKKRGSMTQESEQESQTSAEAEQAPEAVREVSFSDAVPDIIPAETEAEKPVFAEGISEEPQEEPINVDKAEDEAASARDLTEDAPAVTGEPSASSRFGKTVLTSAGPRPIMKKKGSKSKNSSVSWPAESELVSEHEISAPPSGIATPAELVIQIPQAVKDLPPGTTSEDIQSPVWDSPTETRDEEAEWSFGKKKRRGSTSPETESPVNLEDTPEASREMEEVNQPDVSVNLVSPQAETPEEPEGDNWSFGAKSKKGKKAKKNKGKKSESAAQDEGAQQEPIDNTEPPTVEQSSEDATKSIENIADPSEDFTPAQATPTAELGTSSSHNPFSDSFGEAAAAAGAGIVAGAALESITKEHEDAESSIPATRELDAGATDTVPEDEWGSSKKKKNKKSKRKSKEVEPEMVPEAEDLKIESETAVEPESEAPTEHALEREMQDEPLPSVEDKVAATEEATEPSAVEPSAVESIETQEKPEDDDFWGAATSSKKKKKDKKKKNGKKSAEEEAETTEEQSVEPEAKELADEPFEAFQETLTTEPSFENPADEVMETSDVKDTAESQEQPQEDDFWAAATSSKKKKKGKKGKKAVDEEVVAADEQFVEPESETANQPLERTVAEESAAIEEPLAQSADNAMEVLDVKDNVESQEQPQEDDFWGATASSKKKKKGKKGKKAAEEEDAAAEGPVVGADLEKDAAVQEVSEEVADAPAEQSLEQTAEQAAEDDWASTTKQSKRNKKSKRKSKQLEDEIAEPPKEPTEIESEILEPENVEPDSAPVEGPAPEPEVSREKHQENIVMRDADDFRPLADSVMSEDVFHPANETEHASETQRSTSDEALQHAMQRHLPHDADDEFFEFRPEEEPQTMEIDKVVSKEPIVEPAVPASSEQLDEEHSAQVPADETAIAAATIVEGDDRERSAEGAAAQDAMRSQAEPTPEDDGWGSTKSKKQKKKNKKAKKESLAWDEDRAPETAHETPVETFETPSEPLGEASFEQNDNKRFEDAGFALGAGALAAGAAAVAFDESTAKDEDSRESLVSEEKAQDDDLTATSGKSKKKGKKGKKARQSMDWFDETPEAKGEEPTQPENAVGEPETESKDVVMAEAPGDQPVPSLDEASARGLESDAQAQDPSIEAAKEPEQPAEDDFAPTSRKGSKKKKEKKKKQALDFFDEPSEPQRESEEQSLAEGVPVEDKAPEDLADEDLALLSEAAVASDIPADPMQVDDHPPIGEEAAPEEKSEDAEFAPITRKASKKGKKGKKNKNADWFEEPSEPEIKPEDQQQPDPEPAALEDAAKEIADPAVEGVAMADDEAAPLTDQPLETPATEDASREEVVDQERPDESEFAPITRKLSKKDKKKNKKKQQTLDLFDEPEQSQATEPQRPVEDTTVLPGDEGSIAKEVSEDLPAELDEQSSLPTDIADKSLRDVENTVENLDDPTTEMPSAATILAEEDSMEAETSRQVPDEIAQDQSEEIFAPVSRKGSKKNKNKKKDQPKTLDFFDDAKTGPSETTEQADDSLQQDADLETEFQEPAPANIEAAEPGATFEEAHIPGAFEDTHIPGAFEDDDFQESIPPTEPAATIVEEQASQMEPQEPQKPQEPSEEFEPIQRKPSKKDKRKKKKQAEQEAWAADEEQLPSSTENAENFEAADPTSEVPVAREMDSMNVDARPIDEQYEEAQEPVSTAAEPEADPEADFEMPRKLSKKEQKKLDKKRKQEEEAAAALAAAGLAGGILAEESREKSAEETTEPMDVDVPSTEQEPSAPLEQHWAQPDEREVTVEPGSEPIPETDVIARDDTETFDMPGRKLSKKERKKLEKQRQEQQEAEEREAAERARQEAEQEAFVEPSQEAEQQAPALEEETESREIFAEPEEALTDITPAVEQDDFFQPKRKLSKKEKRLEKERQEREAAEAEVAREAEIEATSELVDEPLAESALEDKSVQEPSAQPEGDAKQDGPELSRDVEMADATEPTEEPESQEQDDFGFSNVKLTKKEQKRLEKERKKQEKTRAKVQALTSDIFGVDIGSGPSAEPSTGNVTPAVESQDQFADAKAGNEDETQTFQDFEDAPSQQETEKANDDEDEWGSIPKRKSSKKDKKRQKALDALATAADPVFQESNVEEPATIEPTADALTVDAEDAFTDAKGGEEASEHIKSNLEDAPLEQEEQPAEEDPWGAVPKRKSSKKDKKRQKALQEATADEEHAAQEVASQQPIIAEAATDDFPAGESFADAEDAFTDAKDGNEVDEQTSRNLEDVPFEQEAEPAEPAEADPWDAIPKRKLSKKERKRQEALEAQALEAQTEQESRTVEGSADGQLLAESSDPFADAKSGEEVPESTSRDLEDMEQAGREEQPAQTDDWDATPKRKLSKKEKKRQKALEDLTADEDSTRVESVPERMAVEAADPEAFEDASTNMDPTGSIEPAVDDETFMDLPQDPKPVLEADPDGFFDAPKRKTSKKDKKRQKGAETLAAAEAQEPVARDLGSSEPVIAFEDAAEEMQSSTLLQDARDSQDIEMGAVQEPSAAVPDDDGWGSVGGSSKKDKKKKKKKDRQSATFAESSADPAQVTEPEAQSSLPEDSMQDVTLSQPEEARQLKTEIPSEDVQMADLIDSEPEQAAQAEPVDEWGFSSVAPKRKSSKKDKKKKKALEEDTQETVPRSLEAEPSQIYAEADEADAVKAHDDREIQHPSEDLPESWDLVDDDDFTEAQEIPQSDRVEHEAAFDEFSQPRDASEEDKRNSDETHDQHHGGWGEAAAAAAVAAGGAAVLSELNKDKPEEDDWFQPAKSKKDKKSKRKSRAEQLDFDDQPAKSLDEFVEQAPKKTDFTQSYDEPRSLDTREDLEPVLVSGEVTQDPTEAEYSAPKRKGSKKDKKSKKNQRQETHEDEPALAVEAVPEPNQPTEKSVEESWLDAAAARDLTDEPQQFYAEPEVSLEEPPTVTPADDDWSSAARQGKKKGKKGKKPAFGWDEPTEAAVSNQNQLGESLGDEPVFNNPLEADAESRPFEPMEQSRDESREEADDGLPKRKLSKKEKKRLQKLQSQQEDESAEQTQSSTPAEVERSIESSGFLDDIQSRTENLRSELAQRPPETGLLTPAASEWADTSIYKEREQPSFEPIEEIPEVADETFEQAGGKKKKSKKGKKQPSTFEWDVPQIEPTPAQVLAEPMEDVRSMQLPTEDFNPEDAYQPTDEQSREMDLDREDVESGVVEPRQEDIPDWGFGKRRDVVETRKEMEEVDEPKTKSSRKAKGAVAAALAMFEVDEAAGPVLHRTKTVKRKEGRHHADDSDRSLGLESQPEIRHMEVERQAEPELPSYPSHEDRAYTTPKKNREHEREPSPVDSTSKERSSAMLFSSSPSIRDTPTQPKHRRHRSIEEIAGERLKSTDRPRSIFGGAFAGEELEGLRGSPVTPGFDGRQSTPLMTITEQSPEDHSAEKKRRRHQSEIYQPKRRSFVNLAGDRVQSPLSEQDRARRLGHVSGDDLRGQFEAEGRLGGYEETRKASGRHDRPRSIVTSGEIHPEYRSVSNTSMRSSDSISAVIKDVERPPSASPSLRREKRSVSSDLRRVSANSRVERERQASRSVSPKPEESSKGASTEEVLAGVGLAGVAAAAAAGFASSSNYDPSTDKDKGKGRAIEKMTSVYEAWGEVPGSPRSPSRPPSVRKRQSLQILDLESRLDSLVSENRQLSEARSRAERQLENVSSDHNTSIAAQQDAIRTRDSYLSQKDSELEELRNVLNGLQGEVARLTQVNQELTAERSASINYEEQYKQLQAEHESTREMHAQSTRDLEDMQTKHSTMSKGVEAMVATEVATAVAAAAATKNTEINQLRSELNSARDQIRVLQEQILAARNASPDDDVLVARDEDYFDRKCQQLCQHVQQWVLRFSKFSDRKVAKSIEQINNERTVDRFEFAMLDGTDVDELLRDRVKRRDVFMAVVMAMVFEFVFSRYLFGMDREQRSKLKGLEKTLSEVGTPAAVNRWRATTLTLLSRREKFKQQREQDAEAVVAEIMDTLSSVLPPPQQVGEQLTVSLAKVMKLAVDLSIEMRTQRAEYTMLPPLQPEYDTHGDLKSTVAFRADLMNERSGAFESNDEVQATGATVRMVLFPLVVKRSDDDEVVVCPAQVLVAREDDGRGNGQGGVGGNDDAMKSRMSVAPSTFGGDGGVF